MLITPNRFAYENRLVKTLAAFSVALIGTAACERHNCRNNKDNSANVSRLVKASLLALVASAILAGCERRDWQASQSTQATQSATIEEANEILSDTNEESRDASAPAAPARRSSDRPGGCPLRRA